MNDNLSIFGKTYTGVTAITLTDTNNQQQKFINTADANVTSNDILSGKTAYVNGSKITGNIPSQEAQTITPGTTNQTIAAGKYLTGIQTIAGDSNLVAENITEGVSIFGVVGVAKTGGDTGGADEFIENHGTITEYTGNASIIGKGAFCFCSNLITANFPNCTDIEYHAFYYCRSLTTISFPNCTNIEYNAFYNCNSLTTANFPKCASIGSSAFAYCLKLTSVSFPECRTIEHYAFSSCNRLTSVNFPACEYLGWYVFYNCNSLKTAIFPKCTGIGSNAFGGCTNLTTVSFPNCTNIGIDAFLDCCYKLTSVSFPACKNIGNGAFKSCYSLISLYLTGSSYVSLAHSNAFSRTPIAGYTTYTSGVYGSIYVPASMLASYKTRTNWTYFSNRMVGV